jgi:N-acetylmuramoyl-L-alanine amidase
MTDDADPSRRAFGEHDENDRRRPFGSGASGKRPPFGGAFGEPRRPPAQPVRDEDQPEGGDDFGADTPLPPDEPLHVPLVRVPAEAPDAGRAPEEGEATLEPVVRGEPLAAPALVRVRERRRDPHGPSFLKSRLVPPPDPAAAPEAASGAPPLQLGVILRTVALIFLTGALSATLFTWWTPNTFLPAGSVDQLSVALATQSSAEFSAPTTAPTPIPLATSAPDVLRVGIVSGHRGIYPPTGLEDPGAVCADGLTEASVNAAVAERVVEWLSGHGYQVDLFDEFDPRLDGYSGDVLLSIHADSCEYINDVATGFKVASFSDSIVPEEDARLVACLIDRYAETTGLTFHPSVTYDMTQYHTFREIAPGVPGAIIEIGFLYMDRSLLENNPDVVALGVARGLLCYLRGEPVGDEAGAVPAAETPAP